MKPEKAGNDFIEHLPYIERVIFSAGGYFGGFERTTVHFPAVRLYLMQKP